MSLGAILPWVTLVKDIVTGVAALVAGCVAVYGVTTWRRQMKGQADHDLARRLLTQMYRLRESVAYLREPLLTAGELAAAGRKAELEAKETSDSKPSLSSDELEVFAYNARWRGTYEAIKNFRAVLEEAEALWGAELRNQAIDLGKRLIELESSLNLWASKRDDFLDPDARERLHNVISGLGRDEPDPFRDQIQAAMQKIEAVTRPRLLS